MSPGAFTPSQLAVRLEQTCPWLGSAASAVARCVSDHLKTIGKLKTVGPALALATHEPKWTDTQKSIRRDLLAGYSQNPSMPEQPDALVAAVRATGATRVYVHVDLDVLDPAAITGIGFPTPFGVALADLVAAIGRLRGEFPLAGATITEFAPSSPDAAVDDLGTILRIVGALT